jgi:hypothetical protein
MTDGSRATLRANQEKGTGPIGGGRLAATIAGSPVLLWVKGKDVVFQKGMEVTAFINTDARLDEDQLRRQVTASTGPAVNGVSPGVSTDRIASPNKSITNSDLIEMRKVGLSDDVILTKIRTTGGDFRTGPQDLIQLKEAGVSDAIIREIVQQSGQR